MNTAMTLRSLKDQREKLELELATMEILIGRRLKAINDLQSQQVREMQEQTEVNAALEVVNTQLREVLREITEDAIDTKPFR